MPAVSKAQFRFMQMVASGKKKVKGLSKKKAKEFVTGVNYSNLTDRRTGGTSDTKEIARRITKKRKK